MRGLRGTYSGAMKDGFYEEYSGGFKRIRDAIEVPSELLKEGPYKQTPTHRGYIRKSARAISLCKGNEKKSVLKNREGWQDA